jgi:hypothetical protein
LGAGGTMAPVMMAKGLDMRRSLGLITALRMPKR